MPLHRSGDARAIVVAWCLSIATGCGGEALGPAVPAVPSESLPVVTSMSVVLSVASVTVGQQASASVAAVDEKGRPMTVGVIAWTTSRANVATVSADGVVSALSEGQAVVTARVGTIEAQATIIVAALPAGPAPVAAVSVSPSTASCEVGHSLQLAAKPRDFFGNPLDDRSVTWTSSESTVATISPSGLVTALAPGTAVLEATSESGRGAMVIYVTAAIDTQIVVSVMVPTADALVGDTIQVVSTVRSLFAITSVVASAGGQHVPLVFGPIGGEGRAQGWSVNMDISTLPFGAYAIVVTATDSRGHRGIRAVPFVRNPRVPGGSKPPSGSK